MSIRVRNIRTLLNILLDVKKYIFLQTNNEKLASDIIDRIDNVFKEIEEDKDGSRLLFRAIR